MPTDPVGRVVSADPEVHDFGTGPFFRIEGDFSSVGGLTAGAIVRRDGQAWPKGGAPRVA